MDVLYKQEATPAYVVRLIDGGLQPPSAPVYPNLYTASQYWRKYFKSVSN